jgi:hypothetical protein
MATLHRLVELGTLIEVTVPLDPDEFPLRWFYCFPDMRGWIENELPKLKPGRLKSAETPEEQFDNVLYKWTSGRRITYEKMFQDLRPIKDEVWEMKTCDLRLFGWMYQPRRFIAVFGDYADHYKQPTPRKSYETARNRVLEARKFLDLDEPKFSGGTFDDLVHVQHQ